MQTVRELWEEVLPDLVVSIPFSLERCTKVVFRVGSHSHGTYISPEDDSGIDDVDLMVVCVPPPEFKLGLRTWEHAEFKHSKWDVVFYDWQKWLIMVRKSNPNVVGTLWLEDEDIYIPNNGNANSIFDLMRNRRCLLSKQMYPAFVGYAKGQFYKMTHLAHQGYMGEKRKRLVEKYGYDVKNAAHMIRLLRMACEVFEYGRLQVKRTFDAEELIEIKTGKWSLDQVIEESQKLLTRAEGALSHTTVREFPDDLFIQKMMVQGYQENWEPLWWEGVV